MGITALAVLLAALVFLLLRSHSKALVYLENQKVCGSHNVRHSIFQLPLHRSPTFSWR